MRLLVVDGSELMSRLVERLAPPEVSVECVLSFRDAERRLEADPPDAVIFNLTPCDLRWQSLIEHCQQSAPPIPFLCSSSLEADDRQEGAQPCRTADVIMRSVSPHDLQRSLAELIARVQPRSQPVD